MTNPTGLCKCGCGEATSISTQTNVKRGHKRGEHVDYIRGHSSKRYERTWNPNDPLPLCACGCGQQVTLSKNTQPDRGIFVGEPNQFARGHRPIPVLRWSEEDRGFESPCWIYVGPVDNRGYGRYRDSNLAHRWIYERLERALVPTEMLHHRCEQKLCVNPDHLQVMTRSAHMTLHRTKITPDQAHEILVASGSQRAIAQRYGISQGLVWQIKHGKRRIPG